MSDVLQAQDVINGAQAEVMQAVGEVLREWFAPEMVMMVKEGARAVMAQDETALEILRQMHPDEMAMIEEIAGGE